METQQIAELFLKYWKAANVVALSPVENDNPYHDDTMRDMVYSAEYEKEDIMNRLAEHNLKIEFIQVDHAGLYQFKLVTTNTDSKKVRIDEIK